jgi:hypothetical protein
MEEQREQAFKVIDEMRAAFKDVPPEEIDEQVDKALEEVRTDKRQQAAARKQE